MSKKIASAKKDEKNIPFIHIIISSIIGTLFYYIFIAIFALSALESSINQSSYFIAGLILSGVAGLISGFISVKLTKEKGMFFGGLTGFIQSVFSSIIIFCLNKGTAGKGIFVLIGLTTLMSAVSGVIAVNIKKKIKY